ncbi:D-amino acid oxidase-like protein [Bimuria novae-zelandiae CBS 107.79]|uniref:D-amino acid oxidase-like protein n=1 Tax=Bimuria novae-zelandiae CBS 107.79 TaxID=1447943 RepID=A0A6A5V4Z9_9PLEO|nr:D-amino acid oxidase-like protein [Bimuria novae-zelandiae CBS 107.79]
MPNIVVIGAGVSGLTSAYLLSKDQCNHVAVVAKHMPGDYDIEYASPWAGANFMPMSAAPGSRWERRTWPQLKRLATDVPEAGIHLQKCQLYRRHKDLERLQSDGTSLFKNVFAEHPWYRDLVDDYRDLQEDELPQGIASGCEFGSVCINPALYLSWLVGQCRANGVIFHRKSLTHISEVRSLEVLGFKPDVIVNATGLSAAKLGGVRDQTVYPIRGQTVVVRNVAPNMLFISGTDDGENDACYMMTRAAGGGTILGGTTQSGNWESQPDPNTASLIMKRAVSLAPELTGGKGFEHLDVIRHGVGLRPGREDGVRIEKEKVDGIWVVHNYGHAGWGYQGSYGCAEEVVALVNGIGIQAKL